MTFERLFLSLVSSRAPVWGTTIIPQHRQKCKENVAALILAQLLIANEKCWVQMKCRMYPVALACNLLVFRLICSRILLHFEA